MARAGHHRCTFALHMDKAMRVYPASYSAVGLDHAEFRQLCERVAADLPEFMKSVGAYHAIVRGTSGTSVAFGLRMIADLPLVVARKPGEQSHAATGISAVGNQSVRLDRYVILDDFVSSGATIRGIVHDMEAGWHDDSAPTCVGLFLYSGGHYPSFRLKTVRRLPISQGTEPYTAIEYPCWEYGV